MCFDFHTPSEHKGNGVHYELEIHFMHELDQNTDASEWSCVPHKTLALGVPPFPRRMAGRRYGGTNLDGSLRTGITFDRCGEEVVQGSEAEVMGDVLHG